MHFFLHVWQMKRNLGFTCVSQTHILVPCFLLLLYVMYTIAILSVMLVVLFFIISYRRLIFRSLIFVEYVYSAYHQIVTITISKKKRNYLEEFSSLVVFLVDNYRKFPKKSQKITIWWLAL